MQTAIFQFIVLKGTNMIKKLFIILLFLLIPSIGFCDWKFNPYTGKLDYYEADTNTTYTAGDALTLTGTDIDFDGGASPGGELGGTWASPTVDSGIHDDEYISRTESFDGDVTGPFSALIITKIKGATLPAGTGAANQILKLTSPTELGWAADADSGGGSGAPTDPVYFIEVADADLPNAKTTIPIANLAVIPLATHTSGTLPIANVALIPSNTHLTGTIAAANLGLVNLTSQVTGTLPIANVALIPGATHITGTVPIASVALIPANTHLTGTIAAANLGLVNLTSQVSGTLPTANYAKVPANTHLTGTIAAANLGLVAANTQLSGTIAAANLGLVALATQVSGTIPAANLGIKDLSTNVSGTVPAANLGLIADTSLATKTIPLMALSIMNPEANMDNLGGTLSDVYNYKLVKVEAQMLNAGTNVIFTLKCVKSDGTTLQNNLSVGQTATRAKLNITTFTGGTIPATYMLVPDIDVITGGDTRNMFRLRIWGQKY